MGIPTDLAKKYRPLVDAYSMGDERVSLIIEGKKTAACGSRFEQERDGYPIPKVGDYYLILDGQNRPAVVVQTVEVTLRRFDEVDSDFARDEGEGDLSYEFWHEGHKRYFERHGGFSADMELICERFRLIEVLERAEPHVRVGS